MKRDDFGTLDGIPLIWACIEPTIQKVRGKNFAIKSDVYAQLTDGQRALLMFQILYGHTLHGVEEFYIYHSYMLLNKGTRSQMINGMNCFGASGMVRFLDELHATYERFHDDMEQRNAQFDDVKNDTPLYTSLNRLNVLLRECLPETINLVSSFIQDNAEQFVKFDD
jgi:hypothetical protein